MNESVAFTKLADDLLMVCGAGDILVTGERAAECCAALWLRDARARSAASLPEALRSSPWTVDAVFCLDFFDRPLGEETAPLLHRLYQAAPRYVCVYVDLAAENTAGAAHAFEQWEKAFFAAGFRRHPRLFHTLNYRDRECPPARSFLCFERIRESALAEFPLQLLHGSRLLHMDMLRDGGRRSDAHLMRYFAAASCIRPGDTVLDCACGLGYGSHMLYHNSRAKRIVGVDIDSHAIKYAQSNYGDPGIIDFALSDAQDLAGFANNSFDFIAGFETIEHVPEPEKYLRELFRVLRPSGRIMVSAPDMWVDETGKDPNPHHFHVYTWDRLHTEIASLFIPEKGFLQTAGGALKLPQGTRQWREIPCKAGQPEEAEWLLMTAMKSPLLGRGVPYDETAFPHTENPEYHVGAFGRDYGNPWLVKGMVARGLRLSNSDALYTLQEKVIAEYPPDSVDYGAALCGKCYALLSSDVAGDALEPPYPAIEAYAALQPANPHVMRWQVSLLFVAALLRRKHGELEAAETLFMRCAAIDVAPYSPLLGNKTLDALYSAAALALARGETETAGKRLAAALEEAVRLARGSWLNILLSPQTPFEPGFPEMAQLMDKAARCCYMLGELHTVTHRPGLAYSRGQGWYETLMASLQNQIADQRKSIDSLLEYARSLRTSLAEREQQLVEQEKQSAERHEHSKSWRLAAPLRKLARLFLSR